MGRQVSINLRLDEEMHAELTRIAEEEERSVAGQIRLYLKRAIEEHRAERHQTTLGEVFARWKQDDVDRTDETIMTQLGADPEQYAALQGEVLTPGTSTDVAGQGRVVLNPAPWAIKAIAERHNVSAAALEDIIKRRW